ncbi:UNVERIFIED_ORG: hypothetical protein GGI57_004961 [Rhizobium aethiopicum]
MVFDLFDADGLAGKDQKCLRANGLCSALLPSHLRHGSETTDNNYAERC